MIIGGGPVGLSLALLLERFGVDCVVIERNASTTEHPKSRGLTARTMELFRIWGIEEAVRAGGLPPESDIVHWCESLLGPFVGTTHPEASNASPAPKASAPQNAVEEALANALRAARHVDLRRGSELVAVDQTGVSPVSRVRDLATGRETTITSTFVVACDGASSGVRRALGIEMDGPPELARLANHYYAADLSHLPHLRTAVGYVVRPTDPAKRPFELLASDRSCSRFLYVQALGADEEPLSEDDLAGLIREHVELPDLPVTRLSVLTWRMSAQVARAFRAGSVFLAGDAAHRFPPAGGMGLNSGVADAHNLAWKLAFVLRGEADDGLLDTYDAERRPVALSNTAWSTGNFERMARVTAAFHRRDEDPLAWRAAILDTDNHLHSEGQAMGYVYEDGAVVDDGSPVLPLDARYYWPTDRPGARFPHMWVDTDLTRSTIDWFDTELVVVCGPHADGWRVAAKKVAIEVSVPVAVRSLGALAAPLEMGRRGAVLVRPDGHVAWRARGESEQPEHALRAALDAVLRGGADR